MHPKPAPALESPPPRRTAARVGGAVALALLAALLGACAGDGGEDAPRAVSLSVVSFNLRNDEDWWEDRGVLIREGLAAENADLVGLQEVVLREMNVEAMIADITALAPSVTYEFAPAPPPEPFASLTGEGSAILSRFRITESDILYLSEGRAAAWVRVDMGDGQFVDHYNTHLHATLADADIRAAQAEDILEFIDEHDAGWPTVLTGDFNAVPSEPAVAAFLGAGFSDGYAAAHPSGPDADGFTSPVPLAREPVTASPTRRIDYVLFRAGARATATLEEAALVMTQPGPDGLFPSDHFGVRATLQFRFEP